MTKWLVKQFRKAEVAKKIKDNFADYFFYTIYFLLLIGTILFAARGIYHLWK